MEKLIVCKIGDKFGYKFGEKGKCYTYNKNEKSKLKAFELAKKEQENGIRQGKNI